MVTSRAHQAISYETSESCSTCVCDFLHIARRRCRLKARAQRSDSTFRPLASRGRDGSIITHTEGPVLAGLCVMIMSDRVFGDPRAYRLHPGDDGGTRRTSSRSRLYPSLNVVNVHKNRSQYTVPSELRFDLVIECATNKMSISTHPITPLRTCP
jgi:hypothetical protein